MSTLIRGLGRIILFLAFGAVSARVWAQPPLTTIRDTVYRADGRPFNGLVLIQWKTFQASNNANIGTQGTTVSVVNGNLYVRLTPTTTANNAYYLVRYNSDGQFQFSEVWSVPSSSAALRLRDIRATLLPGGILTGGGNGGVVIGETSGGVPGFGDSETPSGAINGTNPTFALSTAPSPPASLALFRNGLLQLAGNDYTLDGATITFNSWAIPQVDDVLDAFYRTPATNGTSTTHTLLSTTHTDTTPTAPVRGGLIVGQGTNPSWSQLLLGPAGRCLTSNGVDVVWNPCLFTGFQNGSVPFVDSLNNLTQSPNTLTYQNLNRRFSIGNNSPDATLNVFDSVQSGITRLWVKGGALQGSEPLQKWFSSNGAQVAFVNADGGISAKRLLTRSSTTSAAVSDGGTPADPPPTPDFLANGDSWYNNSSHVRKTYEANQTHGAIQIVCSSAGATTTSVAFSDLGSCTLPAGYLFAGDRLQIEANFLHVGSTSAAEVDILVGQSPLPVTTLAGRAVPTGDAVFVVTVNLGFSSDAASFLVQSFGVASGPSFTVSQIPFFPGGTFGPIRFRSRLVTPGTDSMRLINFSVRRIPQQANP